MKVMITGGSGGIGFAVATEFASKGYQVVLADLHQAQLDAKVAELRALGYQADAVLLDLNSQSSIEQAAAQAGDIDILVNNAGIQHVARLEDFPEAKMAAIIAGDADRPGHADQSVAAGHAPAQLWPGGEYWFYSCAGGIAV